VQRLPDPVEVINAYFSYNFQSGGQFVGFQLDWESLYTQNVMVMADIRAGAIDMGQVRMIQRWVADGGALVVLGGLMTLGQGNSMPRGWPSMLPVELNMPYEIRECKPAVQFGRPAPSLSLGADASGKAAVVMYRHLVKAKPNATVLLSGTKGEALLVGGSCGKGRVVVFTGSVLVRGPDHNES